MQVFDANHNPLARRVVQFAASLGTITARDTTDADGMATATYTGLPRNGEARILASAQVGDTMAIVGTSVQLEGVTLSLTPLSPDTLIGESVPLIIALKDGDGEPIAAAAVKLQGAAATEGVTDGAGLIRTSVKSDNEDLIKVTATALGATSSVSVGFWKTPPDSRSRTLLLFADPARLAAANGETASIKAILYDDNHNPVAGKRVTFSTTHGLITPSDTTDASGVATAEFQGLAQNADALITASYAQGDSIRRATATITLAGLQIEVKPAAGEALLKDTVPVSIRVRDAMGRALPDVQVSIKGALQSSLRTNASGTATATVTSAGERTLVVTASALGAADSAKVIYLTSLPFPSVNAKAAVGNLRIFVDRSRLKASNTDQTNVRVVAFDKFNNPLSGRQVRFTANYGIITSTDSTDARGEASAVYRAVPINVDARITASMTVEDSSLAVFTTVTLAGLEIDVQPSLTDALLNRTVPVNIKIIDGAGSPVPDATIIFNGNPGQGTTDGEGNFRTAVTSGIQKRVTVTAKALGAQDSNFVDFWTALPTKNDPIVDRHPQHAHLLLALATARGQFRLRRGLRHPHQREQQPGQGRTGDLHQRPRHHRPDRHRGQRRPRHGHPAQRPGQRRLQGHGQGRGPQPGRDHRNPLQRRHPAARHQPDGTQGGRTRQPGGFPQGRLGQRHRRRCGHLHAFGPGNLRQRQHDVLHRAEAGRQGPGADLGGGGGYGGGEGGGAEYFGFDRGAVQYQLADLGVFQVPVARGRPRLHADHGDLRNGANQPFAGAAISFAPTLAASPPPSW